jgi:hypothetical protein
MPLVIALIVLVVIIVLIQRGNRRTVSGLASSTELQLLRMCLGDREQVERLIAAELREHPEISRSEAVRRAAYSVRRDQA